MERVRLPRPEETAALFFIIQIFSTLGFAVLYSTLVLYLTGSGLNVTCINMMLTQRFAPEDSRRESAFLWNYAGMNIGFFIGFTAADVNLVVYGVRIQPQWIQNINTVVIVFGGPLLAAVFVRLRERGWAVDIRSTRA